MAEEIQIAMGAQPRASLAVSATGVADLALQVSSEAVVSAAVATRAALTVTAQDSAI